jgi:hypothetical protein
MVKHLPRKYEALSSNISSTKKRRKEGREGQREGGRKLTPNATYNGYKNQARSLSIRQAWVPSGPYRWFIIHVVFLTRHEWMVF